MKKKWVDVNYDDQVHSQPCNYPVIGMNRTEKRKWRMVQERNKCSGWHMANSQDFCSAVVDRDSVYINGVLPFSGYRYAKKI
jgi:hypothetical protein